MQTIGVGVAVGMERVPKYDGSLHRFHLQAILAIPHVSWLWPSTCSRKNCLASFVYGVKIPEHSNESV